MAEYEISSANDYLDIFSFEKVDVRELVRYLKTNSHIKRLYINCSSKIKREECKEFSLIKSLDSISIRISEADDESVKALSEISNLTSLIIVGKHGLTSEGAKELSKCTNLIKLTIGESAIEQNDKQCIKIIASVYVESLSKLTNLTELRIKNNFINDEFVKLLADTVCFHNLERLDLSENNNIGNLSASALAKSFNSPKLTHLILKTTNIGFEGAKALALSHKLKNLQVVDLVGSENLHDVEGIEELAKITCRKTKPIFRLYEQLNYFHTLLREVLTNKKTIDEILVPETLCGFTKRDPDKRILKYLLTQKEKYQLKINSILQGNHRYCIFYNFLGQPGAEKLLFELGALPAAISKPETEEETELLVITERSQSVHMTAVVKKTNFFTKYLVDSVNITKKRAEQVLHSFTRHIPSFLQRYQSDPIRLKLLNLTDSKKICVMENTLCGRPLPNDKEFIESVIGTAKITLDEKYNKIGSAYYATRMQYNYAVGEATVTIPQCIGYVKLLIDTFSIPIKEKVELLVTVMEQNPDLVKDKLGRENVDRTQLYEWVKNVRNDNLGQMFTYVSGLDIEQIWREQKEFILLIQIFIAATAYGEDNSACMQGVWAQIVASLDEIDFELLNRYEQHLDRERDRERLMPAITRNNSSQFANDLAQKLIEYAAFRPTARKTLEAFAFGMIDLKDFKNITFEQQQFFSQLNREFTCNVKKFLPNYEREVPTAEEYDVIIENILNSKTLQDFAKGPHRP